MVTRLLPLTLDAIEVNRRGKRLVGPISLTLGGEGITIVMGPNGSGKTTLLRAMHGLERTSAGRITWSCPVDEARAAQAFVFQTPILMRRSVLDCIAFPLRLANVPRAVARKRAAAFGSDLGLGEALDRPAQGLSGGERQKLALARALVCDPALLFLDEPCANLDGRSTREIEEILRSARTGGTRIVMSTHDVGQARRLADDVLFIYQGRLHEAGTAMDFFTQPKSPEARAYIKGDLLP